MSRPKYLPCGDVSYVAAQLQKWVWLVDTAIYTQKDKSTQNVHAWLIPLHTLQVDTLSSSICLPWAYKQWQVSLFTAHIAGRLGYHRTDWVLPRPCRYPESTKSQLLRNFGRLHCNKWIENHFFGSFTIPEWICRVSTLSLTLPSRHDTTGWYGVCVSLHTYRVCVSLQLQPLFRFRHVPDSDGHVVGGRREDVLRERVVPNPVNLLRVTCAQTHHYVIVQ